MRVLVVGSGAREHALCLGLAADPSVTSLVCAPGNGGTAAVAEQRGVDPPDPAAVARRSRATSDADLVVIGPEAPLVAGVADAVRAAGIACFGPSAGRGAAGGQQGVREGRHGRRGRTHGSGAGLHRPRQAEAALDEFGPPYVVKDDGLAAGKGVVVTDDRAAGAGAMRPRASGCVIEEYLDGPEVSLFCVTDGATVVPLLPAQDFKRIGDGDTGPNTGGMGAYAPLPWLPDGLVDDVVTSVARPTVEEMARRGTPFAGLLYIGLALTSRGPRVVEFNARFGDPETQVVLELLDTPLAGLLSAAATGRLAGHPPLRWRDGAAVTVVVAAAGYPGTPRTGTSSSGADQPGVIHAGTRRREDGAVVSNGGRVALRDGVRIGSRRGAQPRVPARRDRAIAGWPVPHRHRAPGRARRNLGLRALAVDRQRAHSERVAPWPPPADDSELGPSSEVPEVLSLAPRWSLSRRAGVFLAVGGAVAAAVAIVGSNGSSSDRRTEVAPPSSTAVSDQPLAGVSLDDAAVHCPIGLRCRPEETVPAATDAAVAQYLPGAVTRRRLTIFTADAAARDPDGLFYRAVNATSGLVEVLVIVTRPASPRPPGTLVADPHPGAWIRYVRRQIGPFEVQVQFTGPPGRTPPVTVAVRLAGDPRLLVPG